MKDKNYNVDDWSAELRDKVTRARREGNGEVVSSHILSCRIAQELAACVRSNTLTVACNLTSIRGAKYSNFVSPTFSSVIYLVLGTRRGCNDLL